MVLIAALYFLVVAFLLGYSLTSWKSAFKDGSEAVIMGVGIGLSSIPLLGVILNVVGMPIHWALILLLSLLLPIYRLARGRVRLSIGKFKLDKYLIILLVIFAALFVMMEKGSFRYPWFEDTDPYSHAASASFISMTHSFSKPADMFVTHYSEPYPQGMPILMGVLHQLEPSVNKTLKFFNAFIISLSILFFYYLSRRLTHSRNLSLLGAFFLASIPSFQSHFIFAQNYALTMFFPALYSLLRIRDDKRWAIPAVISVSSVLLTQQLSSVVLAFFIGGILLFMLIEAFRKKSFNEFLIVAGASIIAAILVFAIFYVPVIHRFGMKALSSQYTLGQDPLHKSFFNFADSSSVRFLTLTDFVHPCMGSKLLGGCPAGYPNKTDNPTGFGWVLFLLFVVGLFYALSRLKDIFIHPEKNTALAVSLVWFFLTFIGVIGDRLPFKILPNRWWAFMSIPVVILAAYGLVYLVKLFRQFKVSPSIVITVVLLGVLLTSFKPKYIVNNSLWMPHVYDGQTEIMSFLKGGKLDGYLWLLTLPKNTPVFDFCMGDDIIFASDGVSFPWDPEVPLHRYRVSREKELWDNRVYANMSNTSRSDMMSEEPGRFSSWLKGKGFKYITINARCARYFGGNKTVERIRMLSSSGFFRVAHQAQGFVAMRVV